MKRLPNAAPKPPKKRKKPRHPLVRVSVLKRSPPRAKRSTPRRQANRCPELLVWISHQRCWVTGRSGTGFHKIDAAHIRTKRLGGDLNNVIPLEHWTQHMRQHQIGIESWLKEIGRTREELEAAAVAYTKQFHRQVDLGWTAA